MLQKKPSLQQFYGRIIYNLARDGFVIDYMGARGQKIKM